MNVSIATHTLGVRVEHRIRHLVSVAFAALAPAAALAQNVTSSVDLQATRLRYADTVDATAAGITPSISVDWERATLAASGTYAHLSRAWSADGSASASIFTPTRRGLSGELAGTVGGSTHEDGTHTAAAMGAGRLHLDGTNSGAWLGAGIGTTSDGFVWRAVRQGEAGVWLANGPATLTLAALPTTVDDSIRYADLSTEGSWRGGRLELDALVGTRTGARLPSIASNVTTWASASAAVWIVPRVAIVASAGTYPVDYTQGFPGGRFASVGVRLALARRVTGAGEAPEMGGTAPGSVIELRVDQGPPGSKVLRVRAPRARTVEMMGDLTAWKPRRLAAEGNGWFALDVPVTSGSYETVIRTDGGAWEPPPGTPTVHDEFGGATGVVVIE